MYWNYSSDWYNSDFSSSFNITDLISTHQLEILYLYYDTIDNKATAVYKFAKIKWYNKGYNFHPCF